MYIKKPKLNPINPKDAIELLNRRIRRQKTMLDCARVKVCRYKKSVDKARLLAEQNRKLKISISLLQKKNTKNNDIEMALVGSVVFSRWANLNGFTAMEIYVMSIINHYGKIFLKDFKYFLTRYAVRRPLNFLIRHGYALEMLIKVAGKNRPLKSFALTKKGHDLMADREKFFYEKFEDMKNKKLTKDMRVDLQDEFRRFKLKKRELRILFPGQKNIRDRNKTWMNTEDRTPETRVSGRKYFHPDKFLIKRDEPTGD